MKLHPTLILALLPLCLGIVSNEAPAQIKSFTLDEMVQTADGAVFGQIIGSQVLRIVDASSGQELFVTRLTVEGRSLSTSRALTVQVVFDGGFIDETHGYYNSESPAADDVEVGKRVLAFYRWSEDTGSGFAANSLVAAHGGLYRTVEGPRGAAVLGRGEGYAIAANTRLAQMELAIRELYVTKKVK